MLFPSLLALWESKRVGCRLLLQKSWLPQKSIKGNPKLPSWARLHFRDLSAMLSVFGAGSWTLLAHLTMLLSPYLFACGFHDVSNKLHTPIILLCPLEHCILESSTTELIEGLHNEAAGRWLWRHTTPQSPSFLSSDDGETRLTSLPYLSVWLFSVPLLGEMFSFLGWTISWSFNSGLDFVSITRESQKTLIRKADRVWVCLADCFVLWSWINHSKQIAPLLQL